MLVSLILPAFCRADLLDLGLWSISKLDLNFPLEIVVLNDGVEDETATVCKKYRSLNIKYIFTGQRNTPEKKWRVPGFAINIGVKQCTGKIIILSNPEIFHLKDNFTLALPSLKPNSFVSPSCLYFDDENIVLPILQQKPTVGFTDEQLKQYCKNEGKNKTAVRMPFFTAMYKKDFIDIGGYDERFTGFCGDDNDFADRIMANNKWVKCEDMRLIHLYHTGSNISSAPKYDNPAWVHNYNLWQENKRNNVVVVNKNIKWGIMKNNENNVINSTSDLSELNVKFEGRNNTVSVGKNCIIKETNIIFKGDNHKVIIGDNVCLYGGGIVFEDDNNTLEIGDKTVIHADFSLDICEPNRKITIGKNCLFSWVTRMRTTDSHSIIDLGSNTRINYGENIIIGNHVWVCELVTILKGAIIPDNCIVGTKSLVTKRVFKPNSLIAGNPAKTIKTDVNWEELRRKDI